MAIIGVVVAGAAGMLLCLPARDPRPAPPAHAPEPEAVTVASPFAGRVREVLAAPGDRVAAGQILLRLGNPEIEAQAARARAAFERVPPRFMDAASSLIGRVPGPTWKQYVQTDPELRGAEQEYTEALAAFERTGTPASKARLANAESRRMEAQRRVGELRPERLHALSDLYRQNLSTLDWIEQQRRKGDVRSPVGGVVEILDLKAGDPVAPLAPLVLVAKEP